MTEVKDVLCRVKRKECIKVTQRLLH